MATEDSPGIDPKSLLSDVPNRLNHPFIGSFITAFILIQWRVFVILVTGGSSFEAKNIAIQEQLTQAGLCHLFVLPIIIALAYTAFLPFGNWVISLWENKWRVHTVNSRAERAAKYQSDEDYLFYQISLLIGESNNAVRKVRSRFQNSDPQPRLDQLEKSFATFSGQIQQQRSPVMQQANATFNATLHQLKELLIPDNHPTLFQFTETTLAQSNELADPVVRRDVGEIARLAKAIIESRDSRR